MANLFSEEPAGPGNGKQEISELADIWAAAALRDALEPNVDDILQRYRQLLSQQPSAGPPYPVHCRREREFECARLSLGRLARRFFPPPLTAPAG
jgi:hypothetical protein